MKRTVLLSICFLLLAVLCACAASPTMDLSGFLQSRKALGAPLDPSRLYRTESDDGEQFWLPQSDTLSLRLFAGETGELYECRVLLQKRSPDGTALEPDETEKAAFRAQCAASLQSLCGVSPQEADRLLRSLSVFDDAALTGTGTLTTRIGPFVLKLMSHPLETAFSIRDTRLREEPASFVPESRPLFGDTTATRRETVPHK